MAARPVAGRRRRPRRGEVDQVALGDPSRIAAGRHAVDVGRIRAEEADAGPGERLELVGIGALLGQDRALVLGAAERVLADHSVAPDDAVARDDQRHGIVAEGRPDRADCLRPADLGRDPAVRPDLAARDFERLHPDGLLERRRAAQVQVDPVVTVACEAPLDLPGQLGGQRVAASGGTAGPGVKSRLECGIVGRPGHLRHAAPVPGHAERSDGRVDHGIVVGQPDGDQRRMGQTRGRRLAQARQAGLRGGIDRVGHAGISSCSRPSAARSAVRRAASPRWT